MPHERVVTIRKPKFIHTAIAAGQFVTLMSLSAMALRMAIGESDIAAGYQPSLDYAKSIDSDHGVSGAEISISAHRTNGIVWFLTTLGLAATTSVIAGQLTKTTKTSEWVYKP